MRILSVEHEPDSGASLLAERALMRGFTVQVAAPPSLPLTVDGFGAVLVMGASPSVHDLSIAQWVTIELQLLRNADARGVPVLGVCFGAQALAVALGGSVQRAPRPEYGWHEIETDDPALVPPGPWAQWHVDAITPPPGARLIARANGSVQAYTVGRHLGVQFHPEVTPSQLHDWAAGDPGAGLDPQRLRAQSERIADEARKRAFDLFDRWLARAVTGRGW